MGNFSWFPRRIPWRWTLVGLLVMLTVGLGCLGFHQHFRQQRIDKSWWDVAYLTLQLFTLESGAVDGPVNPPLQVARFLGPIAAAYAVVLATVGLFSDQIRRAIVGWRGAHVVVCGLGRKGERLVEQLRRCGKQVVVIEANENNPNLHRCRELGCVVIVGRADDRWNLAQAHVARASAMIAAAGDDGVNIETAVRAHDLVQQHRRQPLRCVVHLADPDLQALFRLHDIFTDGHDPFELEFFNTFEVGARIILAQSGLFDPLARREARSPHLLIVGLGHLGEALLRRAIKNWCVDSEPSAPRLKVTVVDVDGQQRDRSFRQRYAELAGRCDLRFLSADVRMLLEDDEGAYLALLNDVSAVAVCLDDDAKSIYAGLTLRSRLPEDVAIVVRASEQAGLASLLGRDLYSDGAIHGVAAVGLAEIGCTLELVLEGHREVLAQAIHQGYVQDQLASGHSPADNPAMLPWHRLPAEFKESSRRQADDIRHKLQAIGCDVVVNPQLFGSRFRFTEAEIEMLARREHERWVEERLAAGWRWGAKKDIDAKTNPNLLPWDDVPEETKGYNREAIRRIPRVLAKADLEIRRHNAVVPRRRKVA